MQDVAQPPVEQQHRKAVDQRPGAGDGRGLFERQRLFGNVLVTTGADRAGQACERSLGGLMLHLHCPVTDGLHVGLVHGGVVGVAALLAAAVIPRSLELGPSLSNASSSAGPSAPSRSPCAAPPSRLAPPRLSITPMPYFSSL